MRHYCLLFLFSLSCTGSIRSITYDADVRWDRDQPHVCLFTVKDKRLDCMGEERTERFYQKVFGLELVDAR